jgi:hypothetical protein
MSYLNPAIKEVYLKEPVSAKDLVQMLNGETLIGGRPQASPTNLEKNFHSALDYVFESASTSYISACVLDSSRFLVAYRDVGNSNYGTAIVLSISGTTITALSPAFVFESASTSYISACVLDSSRVLVAYRDGGNYDYGTAIVLSISGTTITAPSSAFVFKSAATTYISACVLGSSRVLVAYTDGGNFGYGKAIVLSMSNNDNLKYGIAITSGLQDTIIPVYIL